jgi:integrase
MGVFSKNGAWWIEYYVKGRRKRERIGGPLSKDMKKVAFDVLAKRRVELAEGKYLDKLRPVTTTFDELAATYLKWISPNEQAGIPARKRSWETQDRYSISQLQAYFGGKRLTSITPALIEQYRAWRRSTISRRQRPITPATVNRELACLKRMFNVARKGLIILKGGVPLENPMMTVSLEREHNERDRVLSSDEFARLYQASEEWVKPILLMAYHTGMRKGEIRSLRWDQIDLRHHLIRLKSADTKTDEGRTIPLNQSLTITLKSTTRYLGCPWVFVNPAILDAWKASPGEVDPRYHKTSISHAFTRACKRAAVENATFHDLRHTFVTNARRAGVDYFRIMAITGHRTMSVFKRYNTVDEHDLRRAMLQMDTYMDTSPEMDTASNHVTPRKTSRSRRSSAGRATDS